MKLLKPFQNKQKPLNSKICHKFTGMRLNRKIPMWPNFFFFISFFRSLLFAWHLAIYECEVSLSLGKTTSSLYSPKVWVTPTAWVINWDLSVLCY